DARLTETGRKLGLVDDQRWVAFSAKQEAIAVENQRLKSTWIQPGSAQAKALADQLEQPLSRETTLRDLLKRPQLSYDHIEALAPSEAELSDAIRQQVEISAKYE